MASRGRSARNKGHQFERNICADFRELGFDVMTSRAGDQSQDAKGIDIIGTPYGVQCKRGKKYAPASVLEDVDHECPLLITKADHKKTVAILHWTELKKLLGCWANAKTGSVS